MRALARQRKRDRWQFRFDTDPSFRESERRRWRAEPKRQKGGARMADLFARMARADALAGQ